MFLIDPDHETELSRFLSPRDTVATQPQDLDHRALRVVPEESAPIGSASPPLPVSPAALRVLDEHLAKVEQPAPAATGSAPDDEPDLPFEE
jgi:hypothetical protein